ncbi:hypothetical protein GIB67_015602 [Kingdonia uniflora]|uniref:Carboxypeptidase n=1 Tax=Kingdonia uniflora TaxID=39325 RepID=A0A7J7LUD2_9MAGN|nr:hypothetical protein GIB67_015602 [Kingdonia uniflora]
MFYFFFESRTNKKDSVVIWLTGGPGYSSELVIFYENELFNIAKNLSLAFFTEHPQYAKNDFYIMGESYVGHYIPAFAARVHRGNKAKEGYYSLRFNDGSGFQAPMYYDIRKKCEGDLCYDFSNMLKFLNQKSVRGALGVGEIEFVSCSPTVYQVMLMDWMRNLEVGISALLENGVKLLIYAGEYDLICNWLGYRGKNVSRKPMLMLILRHTVKTTNRITNTNFYYDKQVYDAGHMVLMDQPKATLEMLKRWTKGKLVEKTETEDVVADM